MVSDTSEQVSCACGCGRVILKLDTRGRPRRFIKGHANRGGISRVEKQRKCSVCNAVTTYVDPRGYEVWYIDKDVGLLCKRCYDKRRYELNKERILEYNRGYQEAHKEEHRKHNRRRVSFKGRQIHVESCPRLGQCPECGRRVGVDAIKITNRHHDEYHNDDVLKDTRELCVSCHMKEHIKIRKSVECECYACGSTKTYSDTRDREKWYLNRGTRSFYYVVVVSVGISTHAGKRKRCE